jgi:hypothetical protein
VRTVTEHIIHRRFTHSLQLAAMCALEGCGFVPGRECHAQSSDELYAITARYALPHHPSDLKPGQDPGGGIRLDGKRPFRFKAVQPGILKRIFLTLDGYSQYHTELKWSDSTKPDISRETYLDISICGNVIDSSGWSEFKGAQ